MLRSRQTRSEQPLDGFLPEPIVDNPGRDRSRARGAAGRRGGHRAAGRAGDAQPSRAARVRAARHVRGAVRRDRGDARSLTAGYPSARQPRPPPGAREAPQPDPDLTRQALVDAYFAAAGRATWRRWRRCSTPMSCSVPTAATATRSSCTAPRGSREGRWPPGVSRRMFARRWSTAPPASSRSTASGRSRCSRSPFRRPCGRDRRVQRPRTGRQARHPRNHRLSGLATRASLAAQHPASTNQLFDPGCRETSSSPAARPSRPSRSRGPWPRPPPPYRPRGARHEGSRGWRRCRDG